MEIEKLKEIKKALEKVTERLCTTYLKNGKNCKGCENIELNYCDKRLAILTLTLINELENENERLKWEKQTLEDKDTLLAKVGELSQENAELKDRIAELEKEIKENAFYSKGYAQGIKNTYEVVVPDKLKQFAEMLKGKLQDFGDGGEKGAYITEKDIDETLKEFVKN